MNKRPSVIPLALICAISALTGCAGTAQKSPLSFFSAADANGDGRVSRAEFARAKLRRAFDKLDANGDQTISFEEWKQYDTSAQAREHFKAMDENGDQRVTLGEFLKLAPKHSDVGSRFEEMDKDADSFLSTEEFHDQVGTRVFSIGF